MDPRAPSGLDQRVYDDFAPKFDWLHEDKRDMLLLDLPGFKKEHLKVQVDNFGNLKIGGERRGIGNRWKRFRREFKIPEGCNASEMRARFDNGLLHVIMPKLLTTEDPQAAPPITTTTTTTTTTAAAAAAADATSAQVPPKPESEKSNNEKEGSGEEKGGAYSSYGREEEKGVGNGSGLGVGFETRRRKMAALNVAAAVAVLVAILAYVIYWGRRGNGFFEEEIIESM